MPSPARGSKTTCYNCVKVSNQKAKDDRVSYSGDGANTGLMAESAYKKQKTSAEMDRELEEFSEFLVTNTDLSDFTVVSGAYKWPVHRVIISKGCSFFAKVCRGSFKEARDKVVELPDDDVNSIHRLLMFLYKDDYATQITCADLHQAQVTNEFRDESEWSCPTWAVHTDMYALAEKYDVFRLKELSVQKFVAVFEKNVVFDYDVVLFGNVPVLQQMVQAIYLGTPEDTRNRHLRQFLAKQTQAKLEKLYDKVAFKELTKAFPDFGWDVMVATAGERKKCKRCRTVVAVMGKPACGCRLSSGLACGEEACMAACRNKAAKATSRCPGCGEEGVMNIVKK